QAPSYSAPAPAPRLDPFTQAQQQLRPMRGHNSFSRFVIAWGGWNRLWIMLGTMALSIVVYYYYFYPSWLFAFGFTVLLLIHELGHAFTIRLKKMRATFPIFIPGMGAFVTLPNQPISLRDDAEISLAGPFWGGIASALCLVPAILFFPGNIDLSNIFLKLAFYGLFLNLLNLIPVLPLDGGHIGKALSPWLSVAGLVMLGALYFYTQNFFFLLIGIFGLSYVTQGFNSPANRVVMRRADRNIVAVMYFGLAALLAVGFWATNSNEALNFFLHLRGY
ncbi:MAG: site-2 protease family protein, partial [Ktedonobacterales bacterium]|nr:site-2 protease family protein [Ktedonobacterales bacterium]